MIYVIPGSYREAVYYLHERGINPRSREVVVVTNVERLLGRRITPEDEVKFVGDWSFRKDLHEIWDTLRSRGWEGE